ncbi:TetR/AcrR family transcriptional regulator [Nocardiopsis sp. MG754419]|uniref:TetR/AcrR family transcriptional regulator n=1 Tax=Nocardiopsis sp. MG754419 TaxID=2259865 RepID=UPI001BA787DF|nr:TetR/AcrR family transcriptional regulator [Nocardiopsis sp. MG754419]MBR8743547.1 TetR/AcrR family transcriptional regulator [Nocardiopsis sp. MG754419]
MPPKPSRKPRSDALYNRRRILDAARSVFAEKGIEVSMTEIAQRAGVGIATLYRHFPAKEELLAETFSGQLEICVSALHAALDDPDPWRGFCGFIEKLCTLQVQDRGFNAVFREAFSGGDLFEKERIRAENAFAELARRAKAAGGLRPDFVRDDLTLVIMANSGITADSQEDALAAARRLSSYFIQAFSDAPELGPLPPAPRLGPHPALRGIGWKGSSVSVG